MESAAVIHFCQLVEMNTNKGFLYDEVFEDKNSSSKANLQRKEDKIQSAENNDYIEACKELFITQISHQSTFNAKNYFNQEVEVIISLYRKNQNYKKEVNQIYHLVETFLDKKILCGSDLFRTLIINPNIWDAPLMLLGLFSHMKIMTFVQIFNKIKNTDNSMRLLEDAVTLTLEMEDEFSKIILNNFFSVLVMLSYSLPLDHYVSSLPPIAKDLLANFLPKYLRNINEISTAEGKGNSSSSIINIYELILNEESLSKDSIKQYFSNQLTSILTYQPELPLSDAIQEQRKWSFVNCSKPLISIFSSLISGIGYEEAFTTVDKVVSTLEVNWSYILSFLGSLLIAHSKSADKLKALVELYLRKGCNSQETEYVILGFLFARHACMEGRHIFPTYAHWFGSAFGSEVSSPISSKQNFVFLFRFLTDLVPYETSTVLRAHLHQTIHVPKGCQQVLRDYQHLAKARLCDLGESPSTSDFSVCQELAGNSHARAIEEVKSAVAFYEESGKVHCSILEASIFKRAYFLSSFLPVLLTPRQLPKKTDSKIKLIETLFSLKKIPEKVYKKYLVDCKNVSLELVPMKIESGESSSPLTELEGCLRDFFFHISNAATSNAIGDNEALKTLSKVTKFIEDLTAKFDVKYKDIPTLSLNILEFNSESLLYQVVSKVLENIERLMANRKTSSFYGVEQLMLLFVSSPSLQCSLMVTLLHSFQLLNDQNEATEDVEKKKQVTGVILSEIRILDNLFLKVKLENNSDGNAISASELLLTNLPQQNIKDFCFSSCILTSALHWHRDWLSRATEGEKSRRERMKFVLNKYVFMSSRLYVMDSEPLDDSILVLNSNRSCQRLPVTSNRRVPKCCRILLSENFNFSEVDFKEWIEFELVTPWLDTPLDLRVSHLNSSFLRFFQASNSSVPQNRGTLHNGFLKLFWHLVNGGVHKENCAEMLVILQSLCFDPTVGPICLLEEWNDWRRVVLPTVVDDENGPLCLASYHKKLASFMSLSQSLSLPVFVGGGSLAILNLFSRIILDILNMRYFLYLDVKDTAFFLKCFSEACVHLSLPPNSPQIQSCFTLLKESVLYHLKFVSHILDDQSQLMEQHNCFRSLMKIDFEHQQFLGLSQKDVSILLSSAFTNGNDVKFRFSSEFQKLSVLLYIAADIGHDIIHSGGSFESYKAEGSSDSTSAVVTSQEGELCLCEMKAISVLENVDLNHLKNYTKLQMFWDEETGSSPLFKKCFNLGIVNVLLLIIKAKKISDRTLCYFTLLLIYFHSLSNQFEKEYEPRASSNPDSYMPSLSYLSNLSSEINSFVDILPQNLLSLIPESVLKQCDRDLAASIKHKCRSTFMSLK